MEKIQLMVGEKILWKCEESQYIGKKKWYGTRKLPDGYRVEGEVVSYDKFYYLTDQRIISRNFSVRNQDYKEIPPEIYDRTENDLISIRWENIAEVTLNSYLNITLTIQVSDSKSKLGKKRNLLTLWFRSLDEYNAVKQILSIKLNKSED